MNAAMNAALHHKSGATQGKKIRLFGSLIGSLLVVLPVTAYDGPVLSGQVRGQVWLSHEDANLSSLYGESILKLTGKKGAVFYQTDLRFREGLFFDDQQTQLELKEAYVGYRSGRWETSLGKRVYGWGRVEGYNPTNNLGAFDYFRLSDNPDDQRLGTFLWQSSYRPFEGSEVTLVWQPLFTPSMYRYALFDLGTEVVFTDAVRPKPALRQGNLSLRWNVDYPSVGFSLSYFNGYDPYHGINLVGFDLLPTVKLTYRPDYYRKQSVGADLALPLGPLLVRAEAAYDVTKGTGEPLFVPLSNLKAVVGLETVLAGITTLVHYQVTWTPDWKALVTPVLTDPFNPAAQYAYALATATYQTAVFNRRIMKQEKVSQHTFMVSLQRGLAYETVSIGFTGLYDLTTREYMLRPELAWHCSDALTLKSGALWMKGPDGSLYDYAGEILGGAFVGLTIAF